MKRVAWLLTVVMWIGCAGGTDSTQPAGHGFPDDAVAVDGEAEFAFPELAYKSEGVIDHHGHAASGSTIIVTFRPELTFGEMNAALADADMPPLTHSTFDGFAFATLDAAFADAEPVASISHSVVEVGARSIDEALAAALSIPGVTAASPNYAHSVQWTPNDPLYGSNQSNFRQIYVDKAWDYLAFGANVVVAVIDTGFRKTSMVDLPKYFVAGYDFYYEDTNPNDYVGHGTHVSNTIAEKTDNHYGASGIARYAKIMPLKVFPDGSGYAYENDIIDAINYARTQGARVINMSLGGGSYVQQTQDAVNNAWNAGCMVFAASGNNGATTVSYPAAYNNVIAVGSAIPASPGANPTRSSFSNYGTALDLIAPGEGIVQETFSGGVVGYYAMSGTSMASPHAAAVAAMLISYKGVNPAKVRDAMFNTAFNHKGKRTNALGYGIINAQKAMQNYAR